MEKTAINTRVILSSSHGSYSDAFTILFFYFPPISFAVRLYFNQLFLYLIRKDFRVNGNKNSLYKLTRARQR